MSEKFTVGIIVSNHFGVLSRVAGLYAKRGYNIDSLAVGVTENPAYSRMTIVSTGDEYMKNQVVRQLEKLHDVKMVTLLEKDKSVSNEHLLIKLKTNCTGQAKISELINDYGGEPRVCHFDMYRVESFDDLYSIGFFDYLEENAVILIEWSENIEEFLPEKHIKIKMGYGGDENERFIEIEYSGCRI